MGNRRSGELFGHLETLFRVGTLGGLSDAELLERFVAGRDEAGEANFRALVARHGPMVLRVCRSVLDDAHNAEDAFQVTFLALARKAGSIRKRDSIASWLHGTAHRVARKARVAARRRLVRESRVAEAEVSGTTQPAIDDRELSPILHEEIERLPAKYRAPIVLCYLEGMTQEQAAVELGWPAGTVRGRLARARSLLKSRLTRRGLALSAGLTASGSSTDAGAAGLSALLIEATVKTAIGRSAAGRLPRAAVLLLNAVLRDMALIRWTRLAGPLLLAAVVAGGAAIFLYRGGTKVSGERAPITGSRLIPRPVPTDLLGDPLPEGALARLGTTRFLHRSYPSHVAYSPDGTTLASFDGGLSLWDPATGRELRRIETSANRNGFAQIAFAPDGQSLAVQALELGDEPIPGRGRTYTSWTGLYDARTGREIRRFEGTEAAKSLAFSPDGKVLAGAIAKRPNPGIFLWDVASGRVLRSLGDSVVGTMALAFSPDGKVLVSCVSMMRDERPAQRQQRKTARQPSRPDESLIQLWEVASGKEIRRIGLGKTTINEAVLAPNGKTVATATDTTIGLWDLATGKEIRRFGGAGIEPGHIAFAPDGTKLASTDAIGPALPTAGVSPPLTALIHVWDTATGRESRRWETDNASRICFSPDGTILATVGTLVIRLWDVANGHEIQPQTGHRSAIEDAAFTPDHRSIMTLGRDRTIRFWDPATGTQVRQFDAGDSGIRFAALSADGKRLATGGGYQPTRLWEAASGRELRRFQMPGKFDDTSVECADLSPDGNTLATSVPGSKPDGPIFWDTATGVRRPGVALSRIGFAIINVLRFAPDGKSVASLSGDWVRFWDVATARETRRIKLPNATESPIDSMNGIGAQLAFSPDGKVIAASSERDGAIFLIDTVEGKEIARLEGSEDRWKALCFSPNGQILATQFSRRGAKRFATPMIRLWDVAGRRDLSRFDAHLSDIRVLKFTPDGTRLLSASEDSTALVWDVAKLTGRGKGGSSRVPPGKEETPSVNR